MVFVLLESVLHDQRLAKLSEASFQKSAQGLAYSVEVLGPCELEQIPDDGPVEVRLGAHFL